ncbi:MAG: helicase [Prevotellaceae bacterium]|nr:helicase [Prevotellaceae bacterium]
MARRSLPNPSSNWVKKWHEEEKDDFFKVVYICSNANIADQNIEKLGIGNKMNISESRLSMQHLFITLANNDIRDKAKEGVMPESIIPLTPSTSFRMTYSCGTAKERALMCCLLKRMPLLSDVENELKDFMSCRVLNWKEYLSMYEEKVTVRAGEQYLPDMLGKLEKQIPIEYQWKLRDMATAATEPKYSEKAEVINFLRRAFALISIDMLDPDLVIMDEFQRFSDLIGMNEKEKSEQNLLVDKFFNDDRGNMKILLLSATPYKPYSTLEEINSDGGDEHYRDFMEVTNFLFANKNNQEIFNYTWKKYSAALKRTDVTNLEPLIEAKSDAENTLYKVMCRSERFNSGIIEYYTKTQVQVLPEDIMSYAEGQKLLERLDERPVKGGKRLGNMPMEYVKSSPYLLSFMDKYELKRGIIKALEGTTDFPLKHSESLLLSKYNVNNYKPLPPNNGKLKFLHDIVFGPDHEKKTHLLLWVPASHPYYKAGGIFESKEAARFSKFILFSSWEMVPRMISCMMSYYAELYTLGEIKKSKNNLRYMFEAADGEGSKNRYGRNRLPDEKENPLEYPCKKLAEVYSPEECYGAKLSDIRKKVSEQIKQLLQTNPQTRRLHKRKRGSAENILSLMRMLDSTYEGETTDVYRQSNDVKVLTNIAIASPAVCAYRQSHDETDAKTAAKKIVSIFNKPESAAIIDLLNTTKKSDDSYYENVLSYCVSGNLQAVLDEYAHMLHTNRIGNHLAEAVLGTSQLKVDTAESLANEDKRIFMRIHFAIPFIDKSITDKAVDRIANIRKAFNSPFRPFILSSTSIGQEGLDFHWYARKIVHWNLPSNPVDLEQREGRINRYKCLALRRNVARLFGDHFSWDDMFEEAKEKLKSNYSDMVPYWCLPVKDMSKEQQQQLEYIERIVPLYPFSRDTYKYERLIDVLSLYRMTLGQPRQEELLRLLKDMNLDAEKLKQLTINLCPYDKLHRHNNT